MNIVELKDKYRVVWDDYVESSPHGLPQHLSGWRDVLTGTYGYKTHYLMARENEKPVGVMPLFIVNSRLMGCTASTMPGALCADNPEIAVSLIEHATTIAKEAEAKSLALQDTRQQWPGDLHTTCHHEYRIIDLSDGKDQIWLNLHRNIRRQIRMARKNEVSVRIDTNGIYVDDFHHIFTRFGHKNGTPIFGKKFLRNVIDSLPGHFNIALVYLEKEVVGAYFQLIMEDAIYGLWGATLSEYLNSRAAYLAYWEILSDAIDSGYRFLDMGRSPVNSNVSDFKRSWSRDSGPVYQQVANLEGGGSSQSVVNRVLADEKLQRFMLIWSRLPYPIVQVLGPWFRRHVPFG